MKSARQLRLKKVYSIFLFGSFGSLKDSGKFWETEINTSVNRQRKRMEFEHESSKTFRCEKKRKLSNSATKTLQEKILIHQTLIVKNLSMVDSVTRIRKDYY